MSTVVEIQAAIETLSFKERAELDRWLRAGPAIPEEPSSLNPEEDTPELEAELLKAADAPLKPYSRDGMQAVCDLIVRDHRRR